MNQINREFTQAFIEGRDFHCIPRSVICYRDTPGGRMNLPRSNHVEFPDTPLMHGKPVRRIAMFHNSVVAVLLHPDRLALSAQGWGGAPTTRNLLCAFLEAYRLPGYFHQKNGEFCYSGRSFNDKAVFVFDLNLRKLESVVLPYAEDPILMEVD